MSDFTDQTPFTVTDEFIEPFNRVGNRRALTCGFCMRTLNVGDKVRWIYVLQASNTFVCESCDSVDAATRFQQRWADVIGPILTRWG